jgi:CheY-like chemotaxis protein
MFGRVLIADDEPSIRAMLRRLLLNEGFCVCEAGDGSETLRATEQCEVDIIVMDILMPELSGTEVLRRLRTDPRFAHLPVILMTGSPIVQPLARPYPLGETMLFTKPLNLEQILTTVHQMVQAV